MLLLRWKHLSEPRQSASLSQSPWHALHCFELLQPLHPLLAMCRAVDLLCDALPGPSSAWLALLSLLAVLRIFWLPTPKESRGQQASTRVRGLDSCDVAGPELHARSARGACTQECCRRGGRSPGRNWEEGGGRTVWMAAS